PNVLAQITNESPPPGSLPSGCDYDQRGNWYCWGGAGNSGRAPAPAPNPATQWPAGVDPICGCYQWFNGAPVQIRIDHTVVTGPLTGKWRVANAAQHRYSITWPRSISTVTIATDQKSLSGSNTYGGIDKATRADGSNGLVGTWTWVDVVTMKVTAKSDGTYTAAYSTVTWHGTWKAVGGSARTYTLTTAASDVPVDTLSLAAGGMSVSGADQYGIKISGARTFCSPR
ncbi:MAG: hypothetical protein WA634_08295, partial [Silvibacterium sp.]